jgi:hypothetical protein
MPGDNRVMTEGGGLVSSLGLAVVLDLEMGLEVEDLRNRADDYARATGYDVSLNELRRRVGPALDLGIADHRTAVLAGCGNGDVAASTSRVRRHPPPRFKRGPVHGCPTFQIRVYRSPIFLPKTSSR